MAFFSTESTRIADVGWANNSPGILWIGVRVFTTFETCEPNAATKVFPCPALDNFPFPQTDPGTTLRAGENWDPFTGGNFSSGSRTSTSLESNEYWWGDNSWVGKEFEFRIGFCRDAATPHLLPPPSPVSWLWPTFSAKIFYLCPTKPFLMLVAC